MTTMTQLKHAAAALALAALPSLGLAQVAVIVHPSMSISGAKAEQIADVFLGKSDAVGGASNLTAIDQAEGSAVRDSFYKAAAGRDAAQLKAYWARLTFTGKAKPPQALANDAEVKKQVAAKPGAIGYISAGSADSSVKVVLTVQ
ncbi:hypothetical protein [Roseateles sp. PN1]|uniref:hypothetical protein n=1 Tax=Roseateles sp. PN1 TaxID=3137372 RepID=UPI0025FD5167|nr:hypothetical protein [uncultured Roseateles sp.]